MTEIRKATDGRTRLREGWKDATAEATAERIAELDLDPYLRRDVYPFHLTAYPTMGDGSWQWMIRHHANPSGLPDRSGIARSGGEAMRRADAAVARMMKRPAGFAGLLDL